MPRRRLMPGRRRALAWLLAGALPLPRAWASAYERGLLWRIDGPQGGGGHLFGTLHLGDPRLLALAPAVEAALQGSRHFVAELIDDPGLAQRFLRASRLPPGESLSALVGDDVYASVRDRLGERYGVPAAAADRLRPWAAYLQLARPPGPPAGEILDAALQQQARRSGLRVSGLETLEQQLAALQSIPPPAMRLLLAALAREHDRALATIPALIERYLDEDLAGLLREEQGLLGETDAALTAAHGQLVEQLVDRRNDTMVRTLLPWLAEGGVFVAVGALHLHGPGGLPARLAAAGWRVGAIALR